MKRLVILVAVMAVTAGIFAQTNSPKFIISADRMNVLYAGIENPVSIAISSVPTENIIASTDNGTIIQSDDHWVITPTSPGRATIIAVANINGKNTTISMSFRVKEVPVPIAKVAGKSGGHIDKNNLTNARVVQAQLEDFHFDIVYRVVSFTVTAITSQGERSYTSNSVAFTTEQRELFQSLETGQKVIISTIKAVSVEKICNVSGICTTSTQGPEGIHNLSDIVFTIE